MKEEVSAKECLGDNPMACITADAWHELRLSWHVCEVQLLPMEFLEIKKRASHKNYIRYRNLKSE